MAPLATDQGLFWLLAVLHLAGLASMFLSRLPQSQQVHLFFQHTFLACLVTVGVATLMTILAERDCWVWSGTTFSLMAVGATFDFGVTARAPEF